LDGLETGDDVMVYAEYPDEHRRDEMKVLLSGPIDYRAEVPLVDSGAALRPLVERAWAGARLASLASEESRATAGAARANVHRRIVELSTRHRVLCDATALLVLETDADYARFGIDRRALTDVLTVDGRGLRLEHRSAPVAEKPQEPKIEQIPD